MGHKRSGQAILEYILMVVMLAVTMAVIIRSSNQNIYCLWTGLARQIAAPCPECTTAAGPGADQCVNLNQAGN